MARAPGSGTRSRIENTQPRASSRKRFPDVNKLAELESFSKTISSPNQDDHLVPALLLLLLHLLHLLLYQSFLDINNNNNNNPAPMADSNSLKIMCLFEAASSLGYSSELTCLGAHLYHRFFRVNKQTSLFELYMFGAASLELAHMAYEKRFVAHDLCLVMADILHGQELFIDAEQAKKLRNSMELAVRIMWSHLNETINFKDTRMITPGQLQELYREKDKELSSSRRSLPIEIDLDHESSSSSSGDEDNEIETKSDRLLLKNDPFKISSHRYLVHYLKIIKSFIEPEAMDIFVKLSNVAWAFLCDCHWSSCVTRILYNHLACASLMMAIEVFRPQLERSRQKERIQLWKSLNKNWNYIFCDDFNANHLARAQNLIVEQYNEYDRVVQYELNTFVT